MRRATGRPRFGRPSRRETRRCTFRDSAKWVKLPIRPGTHFPTMAASANRDRHEAIAGAKCVKGEGVSMARTLWLGEYAVSTNQISLCFGVDDLRFTTSYWYGDLDLRALERDLGAPFFRKLVFHIAAFEANKLGSLAPERFDLGPFADLCTEAFADLWLTVFRRVWAQWRYEHNLPGYLGPAILGTQGPVASAVTVGGVGPVETLAFCGGGKDSLVALRLLERAGIPYASFAYAHSVYGQAAEQHRLIDGLIDTCHPARRHRQWVFDDFLDSPVAELRPDLGVRSLTAAETPSSLFGALPVALAHGYRYLAVAHERSADHGNLVWDATGEEVNHQWGKSLEAERLLAAYVQQELVTDLAYFSILKPLSDVVIFSLLGDHVDAVARTHSCNRKKPWCEECPKCAYVWLNLRAYLPPDALGGMFRSDPLDNPANDVWFRQMLGLAEHTPFECVGQVDEARLAFELCRRRGMQGRAMEMFAREVPPVDVAATLARLTAVDPLHCAMPAGIGEKVLPLLVDAGRRARECAAPSDRAALAGVAYG
jgi:hypothetical protein